MGLFSSTPEEKEIYKYVGGLFLRSFFIDLLKLNGLYDIVNGKPSNYVGNVIQSCLEVKTKRKKIMVGEIEPEFYLLVKKSIYIHNHHDELFEEYCPNCNKKLTFSSCDSCGFNIIDDYDINLNELKSINIQLPDNPRSPYSKVINVKVLNYINNKPSYKKLAKPINDIPVLKRKHGSVKTTDSFSNKSSGVQDIINYAQNNNVESKSEPVQTSVEPISTKLNEEQIFTPKSCTLGDLEFNIPRGFYSSVEDSFHDKVIKFTNDYMDITISYESAPNCFTLMQGEYYIYKKTNGLLSKWGDFPPQSYFDTFPRNLEVTINGFYGILRDESNELALGKILNRYNFAFTHTARNLSKN